MSSPREAAWQRGGESRGGRLSRERPHPSGPQPFGHGALEVTRMFLVFSTLASVWLALQILAYFGIKLALPKALPRLRIEKR